MYVIEAMNEWMDEMNGVCDGVENKKQRIIFNSILFIHWFHK